MPAPEVPLFACRARYGELACHKAGCIRYVPRWVRSRAIELMVVEECRVVRGWGSWRTMALWSESWESAQDGSDPRVQNEHQLVRHADDHTSTTAVLVMCRVSVPASLQRYRIFGYSTVIFATRIIPRASGTTSIFELNSKADKICFTNLDEWTIENNHVRRACGEKIDYLAKHFLRVSPGDHMFACREGRSSQTAVVKVMKDQQRLSPVFRRPPSTAGYIVPIRRSWEMHHRRCEHGDSLSSPVLPPRPPAHSSQLYCTTPTLTPLGSGVAHQLINGCS